VEFPAPDPTGNVPPTLNKLDWASATFAPKTIPIVPIRTKYEQLMTIFRRVAGIASL
jgi:hypothetical protein